MILKILILVLGATITVLIVSCASKQKSATVEPTWINNMHRLSAAHLRLMPFVADGRKFADPNMRKQIKSELKQMAASAAALANDNKAPDADPIIAFTAAEFASEAKQAYSAFEMNDLQWSRFALSRTSSYCISCHTRADRGVKDFEVGWTTELSALNPVQNVEFLLANRRYRSALNAAKKLAADEASVRRDPRLWIVTIERVLGMVVRVNKEPLQAEELVQLVVENKSAPNYLRRDALAWQDDIRAWQKEVRRGQPRATLKSVVKLVNRAQESGSQNPTALIQYLRASGMIHELLENPKSPQYGETLLYAGLVSDSLRDLNLGYLDQYYYESCINNSPHSELAERCYVRLEASVYASNPLLELDPSSEWSKTARLADFRLLAKVKGDVERPRSIRNFSEPTGE